jgi:hypothetical protein
VNYIALRLRGTRAYSWVVEGDIEACFDSFCPRKSMRCLRRRIKDCRVLALIWQFLRAGILEEGQLRHRARGVPQGGILTPPTMLRTLLLRALSVRVGPNPKHHRHIMFVNLNPPHQRPHNLSLHLPICRGKIPLHLHDKLLTLANQQSQFTLLYDLIRQLLQLVFEHGHSLFQPFDSWLKLHLLHQAFGRLCREFSVEGVSAMLPL